MTTKHRSHLKEKGQQSEDEKNLRGVAGCRHFHLVFIRWQDKIAHR